MKKEEIHLDDFIRILFGQVPFEFYIELIIRAIFVFALIIFGMKYMGRRMSNELNRSTLGAIATIAAITGLVLLSHDRGLLPPVVAMGLILMIQYFVNRRNYRNAHFEEVTEGKQGTLVKDGVLQWKAMAEVRVSKEQVFAQLRDAGIIHLGSVKRLYMEANGAFSVIENATPGPGLPVIPDWDTDFLAEQQEFTTWRVCSNCGAQQPQQSHCPVCNNTVWQYPVTTRS